ncbi:MAG: MaoC family dehydratase [Roseobacter sp.]
MLTRASLEQSVGSELGVSDWTTVRQDQIDAFADITEDWQPIHLDPAAGQAAGFDGTVAHGFLTLSLLSKLIYEVVPKIEGETASLNYGFDKVRFIAPVPGGAQVRARFSLLDASPRGSGLMLRLGVTVEIQGGPKPALTADWLCLYLF